MMRVDCVCECELEPGESRKFYTVTGHDDVDVIVAYCDGCAELAAVDWNGETKAIEPLNRKPIPVHYLGWPAFDVFVNGDGGARWAAWERYAPDEKTAREDAERIEPSARFIVQPRAPRHGH
jgi:hypothetical protein